jgi:hypothetical protein
VHPAAVSGGGVPFLQKLSLSGKRSRNFIDWRDLPLLRGAIGIVFAIIIQPA